MAAPDQVFVLDFMTQEATTSKHGTLSLIDGVPKSTWTVQRDAEKETFDVPISEEKFRKLWDAISHIQEIDSFRVKSPDARLNITENYVVGVVFSFSGRRGQTTYLVPHAASGAVAKWVREIEAIAGK